MENVAAVILAGGKGTRMQSDLPKVLHQIAGRPMILRTLDNFGKLAMSQIVIVVGHKAEEVQAVIQSEFDCRNAAFVFDFSESINLKLISRMD